MRKAKVMVNAMPAGVLEELDSQKYQFTYNIDYIGPPVSLTMPVKEKIFHFETFPPFFEGLLPEGILLEALLRKYKLDRKDYFQQLLLIGKDTVGAVTVEEIK